jgi:glucosamine--fructose-6-phosphate aminotransferase (isomerizing)
MYLQDEIAQQPAVIQRLLSEGQADTKAAAAVIRAFNPPFVCIAARGTSDHAAIYAQYLFGHALRLPVMLATPSLHTVYAQPADLSQALVIGISQSGKAEDVKAVLSDARRSGALTLAITNFDESPLAQAAELHLPLRAEREFSVAARCPIIVSRSSGR